MGWFDVTDADAVGAVEGALRILPNAHDRWRQWSRRDHAGALGAISRVNRFVVTAIVRDVHVDLRTSNRQDLFFRTIHLDQVRELFTLLQVMQLSDPSAELARGMFSCPGADTCNLVLTRSQGWS